MRPGLLPFGYAVRSLGRRPVRTVLGILGALLVVLLVCSATAFVRGMHRSLLASAVPENVLLLGAGSEESVERSQLEPNVATVAAASVTGIRTSMGVPFVSPEVQAALAVRATEEQVEGELTVIRGVESAAFLVHPQVRVLEGRAPRQGHDEILVFQSVPESLGLAPDGLRLGMELGIGGRLWRIAGVASAPGTVMDGEVWMPLQDLQILTRRSTISCVVMTMETTDGLGDAEAFASQRLDLEVSAMAESAYYREMSAFLAPIRSMVVATTLLIALGGLLGGLNTMYAAFSSRAREFGALQTLGFRRRSLAVSLLQESALLNLTGTTLAVSLGLLLLDGFSIRLSMGVFQLMVDGPVVSVSLLAGVALATVGAFPPLWRCMRLPIPEALRAS